MRLQFSTRGSERASTLIVALCVTGIIAVSLGTYLQLTTNQNHLTARSETWNACMPVLEAGIEEALQHCVRNDSNMVSSGWVQSGGRYRLTNTIGLGRYAVSISTNKPYDVISTGYYPMPGSTSYVSRTVKITTQADPLVNGLIAKTSIGMNGNGVRVDSYDSRDPAKSTNRQYDSAKAGDAADVASLNGKSFSIGNADIWGHALVPPGGSVSTGPNGSVGSKAYHLAGKKGIEAGYVRKDLNRSLPPVTVPFNNGLWPLPGIVDSKIYNYVLNGGNFEIDELKNKVIVTANSSIYVRDEVNVSKLVIKTNVTLKMYVGGPDFHVAQVENENGSGPSLMLYGLPTLTDISFSGDWAGGVYAPSADFSIAGNSEVSGSLIANTISLKGTSAFHVDEAFSSTNTVRAWVITSWKEQ